MKTDFKKFSSNKYLVCVAYSVLAIALVQPAYSVFIVIELVARRHMFLRMVFDGWSCFIHEIIPFFGIYEYLRIFPLWLPVFVGMLFYIKRGYGRKKILTSVIAAFIVLMNLLVIRTSSVPVVYEEDVGRKYEATMETLETILWDMKGDRVGPFVDAWGRTIVVIREDRKIIAISKGESEEDSEDDLRGEHEWYENETDGAYAGSIDINGWFQGRCFQKYEHWDM